MVDNTKIIMEQLAVFFTPAEKKIIRKAAGAEFLKISPYLRSVVMKDLKKKGLLKNPS